MMQGVSIKVVLVVCH